MNAYFLSVLAASLLAAVVGILSPQTGSGKHARLASSLLLLCLLASPIPKLIRSLRSLPFSVPETSSDPSGDPFSARADGILTSASRSYFARALSERVSSQFSLPADAVLCAILWDDSGSPEKVTVLLSGPAIWADTRRMEAYVTDLIGCPCATAIRSSP